MQLDIRTASFILAITHFVQMVIFAHQYFKNKESREIKWWLLWSIFENLAFIMILFRDSSGGLRNLVIVLQNVFMGTGVMFLYAGTMKIFGRRTNRKFLYAAAALLILIFFQFTVISYNIYIRSLVINFYLSFFALWPAYLLIKNRDYKKYTSSCLIIVVFITHGLVFLLRLIFIATGQINIENFFEHTVINHLTYLEGIVVSILWTFGFIVIHNEKLSMILNETKNKFQSLFNTSPDIALITSVKEGRIVEANENFYKVSGYSNAEALGSTTIAMNLWKKSEDRNKIVEDLKQGKPISNFEAMFVKKSGDTFIGLISSVLIKIENELSIMSIVRDVTENKKQERELLESAGNWITTFNAISDPVFLLDPDGNIVDYNRAAELMFGNNELKGKHVCDVVHGESGHIDSCPSAMIRHISKSESVIIQSGGKWFEITSDPIVAHDNMVGSVHVVSDITNKKKSDEKMQQTVKELKQLNDIMIGREIRMTELKQEINELLKKCGSEPKY